MPAFPETTIASYHRSIMAKCISVPLLAMCFMVAMCSTASADQIDGNWCSLDGQRLSIDGPHVITPGGNSLIANYGRHHIDYEIPKGEPRAGDRFTADQLSDDEIRVTIIKGATTTTAKPEIWTPCKPVA
jgi:hypothetical protein